MLDFLIWSRTSSESARTVYDLCENEMPYLRPYFKTLYSSLLNVWFDRLVMMLFGLDAIPLIWFLSCNNALNFFKWGFCVMLSFLYTALNWWQFLTHVWNKLNLRSDHPLYFDTARESPLLNDVSWWFHRIGFFDFSIFYCSANIVITHTYHISDKVNRGKTSMHGKKYSI